MKKVEKFDRKSGIITIGEHIDMKNIYEFFQRKGFFFPKKILVHYFLSLKTKSFVILTGISGTGKTKIAQIFAEYMCQNEDEEAKEKRKAFIPVRPDWMDNRD